MLTQNMQAFGTFQKPLDQDNETSQISIKKILCLHLQDAVAAVFFGPFHEIHEVPSFSPYMTWHPGTCAPRASTAKRQQSHQKSPLRRFPPCLSGPSSSESWRVPCDKSVGHYLVLHHVNGIDLPAKHSLVTNKAGGANQRLLILTCTSGLKRLSVEVV